jgi:hypothetical protein
LARHQEVRKSNNSARTYVQATIDTDTVTICSLAKEKVESFSFDLYFKVSQGVTFSVSGPGEVHLCGYWEPTEELLGDADGFDELEDDEEVSDEDQQDRLVKAKQNTIKNASARDEVDSDEEEEEEEDEDEDELLKAAALKVQAAKGKKKQAAPVQVEDSDDDDDDDEGIGALEESDSEEFNEGDLRKILAEKRAKQG